MNTEEIRQEVAKIQWFHNFELAPGVMTGGPGATDERLPYFQIPQDLRGKRVLDIGCADGYFTFLAEKRGATVVAIDAWPRRGFFFARDVLNSKVEFHHMNIYDISPERLGTFDIVFFFGVYYHLKHPMLALERIASVTRELALIESESMAPFTPDGIPLARFHERAELYGDPTNWWVPNIRCLLQTVRASGFPRVEFVTCYDTRRGIVHAYKGPHTACKPLTEDFFVIIDTPKANSIVRGNITLTGWAVSQLEPRGGIERIIVYLDHLDDPACELGQAQYGIWRPDLTTPFGDTYGSSGYKLEWDPRGIAPGPHTLYVMAEGNRGWHYCSVSIIIKSLSDSEIPADSSAEGYAATEEEQDPSQSIDTQQLLKDAELARLQELVKGYERGRFIRTMRTLSQLRRRVMRRG